MKTYKIIEVTEWYEDNGLMDGDASHEGYRAVQRLLEEERIRKIDNGEADGLPFVCEAESEESAIDKYNEAYCEYDYLKAAQCEFED
jgi:hypothetical protein